MAHSHLNLIWFKKTRLPGTGSNRRISSESIHLALSPKPSSLVIQRSLYFQSYSQTVNNLLETENIPAWEGVKKVKQNSLKYTHVRFARILLINSTPIESRRLSSMQAIHPSIILLCFNSVRVILLILMFLLFLFYSSWALNSSVGPLIITLLKIRIYYNAEVGYQYFWKEGSFIQEYYFVVLTDTKVTCHCFLA